MCKLHRFFFESRVCVIMSLRIDWWKLWFRFALRSIVLYTEQTLFAIACLSARVCAHIITWLWFDGVLFIQFIFPDSDLHVKLDSTHSENPKSALEWERRRSNIPKVRRVFEVNANFSAARVRLTSPLFFSPVLSFPTAFPALRLPHLGPVADFYDSARKNSPFSPVRLEETAHWARHDILFLFFYRILSVIHWRLDYY